MDPSPAWNSPAVQMPAEADATLAPGRVAEDLELLTDFVVEAREHLAAIEQQLLALEQAPANFEGMHSLFRAFHTIKGMAGFLELETIQRVAHDVETLLDLARNDKLAISPDVVDVVLQSADCLRAEVDAAEDRAAGRPRPAAEFPYSLIERIGQAMRPPVNEHVSETGPEPGGKMEVLPPAEPGFLRPEVEADRRGPAGREGKNEPEAGRDPGRTQDSATVRVETAKLDHLLEMIGEMVIAQSLVQQHPAMSALQEPQLTGNLLLLSRITKQVQDATMGVRTIPIGQLFHRSARVVRDLSRRAGKDVVLEMAGEDTELDRKIAEELSDPLLHMIRNALDHGIETPAQRREAGKKPLATLRLAASHQGGQIVVEIGDDGRGLDRERILAKAIQNGLLQTGDQLSDDEVNHLIFEPGFSTAEKITDISGRGVGMDVVKKQVQKLRGRIEIRTAPGKGTHFSIKLPLTLAIIDALIVAVGCERYLLPIASVRQIFRPRPEMLSSIHGKNEMVLLHDRLLPIVRLHQRFHVEPRTTEVCDGLLVEAECEGHVFCLMVDEMLGRQEVVMKGLGDYFKGIPGVSSCAILGDGRVGLILDMAGLFHGPGKGSAPMAALPAGLPYLPAEPAQRVQAASSASMGM